MFLIFSTNFSLLEMLPRYVHHVLDYHLRMPQTLEHKKTRHVGFALICVKNVVERIRVVTIGQSF
ncbi:MAG TPA: hypothetical protein VJ201_00565 [Candidatus Babeliales bacterium]|nr:hypothetical protein [Candidatus Babeliales bacterium]